MLTEDDVKCYNIWEHLFTREDILSEIKAVGNWDIELFNNVTGEKYSEDTRVICVVARKK